MHSYQFFYNYYTFQGENVSFFWNLQIGCTLWKKEKSLHWYYVLEILYVEKKISPTHLAPICSRKLLPDFLIEILQFQVTWNGIRLQICWEKLITKHKPSPYYYNIKSPFSPKCNRNKFFAIHKLHLFFLNFSKTKICTKAAPCTISLNTFEQYYYYYTFSIPSHPFSSKKA